MNTTFRERVASFLRQHEGEWIPAIAFEPIAGRQAWRTRLSECRVLLGMDIANRCRLVRRPDGSAYKLSEYRYVAKGQGVLWEQKSA
jgi:hypothetical protein